MLKFVNDIALLALFVVLAGCGESDLVKSHRNTVKLYPKSSTARYNLGLSLSYYSGKVEEAVAELREAIRLDRNNFEARESLAGILFDQGKVEESIKEYREMIAINPGFFPAHHDLGVSLGFQGKTKEAIKALREAVRLEPESVTCERSLKRLLERQENENRK